MKRVTIGLSSAGRRVELMDCFRQDAAELGLDARVLALDSNPDLSPACLLADDHYRVPPCTDEAFIPFLGNLARSVGIDLLVPTIDTELPVFAAARAFLERECGVGLVAVSSVAAVSLARDKDSLMRTLRDGGIPVPVTVRAVDALGEERLRGPVILKPLGGSSSKGIRRLPSVEALTEAERTPEYVVQQLIDGPEYTVSFFLGPSGELEGAVPHRRLAVREGEVSKAVTERSAPLLALADRIARALAPLGARGPLCYQAILRDGAPLVFEVNARFGGGYPLAHRAGAHFTRRLMEWALGLPASPLDGWDEGVLMLRYDHSVFSERRDEAHQSRPIRPRRHPVLRAG
jgi:carbamoyl-phosphate synthase large subunit